MGGQPWRFWWMVVSAVLVCIGSVGPWASVLIVTVNGLSGDGQVTLVAGIMALIFSVAHTRYRPPRPAWPSALVLTAGVVAGLVGAYDWTDLQRSINGSKYGAIASVGWGLVLVTIAGWSLVLAAVTTLVGRSSEATVAAQPALAVPDPSPAPVADGELPVGDVAEQLKKLAELRDAGIVSEDEFAAKKAELLARM